MGAKHPSVRNYITHIIKQLTPNNIKTSSGRDLYVIKITAKFNYRELHKHFYDYLDDWGKLCAFIVDTTDIYNIKIKMWIPSIYARIIPRKPILLLAKPKKESPVRKFMDSPIYDRNLFRILKKFVCK